MADVTSMLRAGEQAAAGKNWAMARQRFKQVLDVAEHPDALINLSYLESKDGHYQAGLEYALRAFRVRPRQPASLLKILNRLRNFNQTWAIRELIDQEPGLGLLDPRGLHAVSAQLSYIGDQERAHHFLSLALARQRANPPVLLARAQISTFLGRFDDAEGDLQACLKLAPKLGAAWWTLSGLRKQTVESNHVDAIRRELAVAANDAERSYLASALHKEYDDLGDIPAACEMLTLANQAKRRMVEYSDAESRSLFDRIQAIDFSRRPDAPERDLGFTPVFIVGMFRSGTTLLEQLLGGNPNLLNAGELYDVPSSLRLATDYQCPTLLDEEMVKRAERADYALIADSYARGVGWRAQGHSHITDKLPPNFLNVGFICKSLPQARIVHMVRDPIETCFSNLRELFSGAGKYSNDQRELAAYYRRYHGLMAHWRRTFPGRILDVDYAELTADTATVMQRVATHCGLEFLPSMVDPRSGGQSVTTASAVQVRGPVVKRAVPKWDPYRGYLQPLITGLGDLVSP